MTLRKDEIRRTGLRRTTAALLVIALAGLLQILSADPSSAQTARFNIESVQANLDPSQTRLSVSAFGGSGLITDNASCDEPTNACVLDLQINLGIDGPHPYIGPTLFYSEYTRREWSYPEEGRLAIDASSWPNGDYEARVTISASRVIESDNGFEYVDLSRSEAIDFTINRASPPEPKPKLVTSILSAAMSYLGVANEGTTTFWIKNGGDPGSRMDWVSRVSAETGQWLKLGVGSSSFQGLRPEDGWVAVTVSADPPPRENSPLRLGRNIGPITILCRNHDDQNLGCQEPSNTVEVLYDIDLQVELKAQVVP